MFISSIINIWGFVIFLMCLAEAHEFPVWNALGAVIIGALIAFAVLIFPFIILAVMFWSCLG